MPSSLTQVEEDLNLRPLVPNLVIEYFCPRWLSPIALSAMDS